MLNTIELKFKIKAYSQPPKYKKFFLVKKYDGNVDFNKILKDIYEQYSQNKFMDESSNSALIYDSNLFEINYKFVELLPEPEMLNYYDIPIKYLNKQFDITKKIFEIWLDPGIGGDVGRYRGIHFFFHTNEKDIHHRPHIHCKCGSEEFRVDLENIKILDKEFKNKKRTKIALNIIKINQEELIKYWNKVVLSGESLKFKMYCPHC